MIFLLKKHHNYTFFETMNLINILSIKYEGYGGINEINQSLQNYFQRHYFKDNQPFYKTPNLKLFINDKVIQIENDPENDVYNGELGFINNVKLKENKEIDLISVDFGNKIITYNLNNFLQSVKLAYAISVHKFQGSASEILIFLIFKNQKKLLSKKLIYTAFSRAKSFLIVIGEHEAFSISVAKENNLDRKTYLRYLLNFNKMK
ncbi:exodeoxyribonuclease V C-terminal fragment [Mycoplasma mobile 163K]|uniref:Exodeoxyribonuclease V C-terminal n=2 Tax=[Mycoplasma] mobile TaxID=2118 RepID=Q6KIJ4_MYCM1|nr:exodeoxyribonuclease V C-terminal fragment [Mycoplasma mobile 163K]